MKRSRKFRSQPGPEFHTQDLRASSSSKPSASAQPEWVRHAPAAEPDGRQFWHPKIELWPLKKLRPSKPNARTHPKKQRDKLLGVVSAMRLHQSDPGRRTWHHHFGESSQGGRRTDGPPGGAGHPDRAPDRPGEAGAGTRREPYRPRCRLGSRDAGCRTRRTGHLASRCGYRPFDHGIRYCRDRPDDR